MPILVHEQTKCTCQTDATKRRTAPSRNVVEPGGGLAQQLLRVEVVRDVVAAQVLFLWLRHEAAKLVLLPSFKNSAGSHLDIHDRTLAQTRLVLHRRPRRHVAGVALPATLESQFVVKAAHRRVRAPGRDLGDGNAARGDDHEFGAKAQAERRDGLREVELFACRPRVVSSASRRVDGAPRPKIGGGAEIPRVHRTHG